MKMKKVGVRKITPVKKRATAKTPYKAKQRTQLQNALQQLDDARQIINSSRAGLLDARNRVNDARDLINEALDEL